MMDIAERIVAGTSNNMASKYYDAVYVVIILRSKRSSKE